VLETFALILGLIVYQYPALVHPVNSHDWRLILMLMNYILREMRTLVGVLRRISSQNGSMTNTVVRQIRVVSAMLSRKASAVGEIPADFRMMSR
jgi:hypothetical protein